MFEICREVRNNVWNPKIFIDHCINIGSPMFCDVIWLVCFLSPSLGLGVFFFLSHITIIPIILWTIYLRNFTPWHIVNKLFLCNYSLYNQPNTKIKPRESTCVASVPWKTRIEQGTVPYCWPTVENKYVHCDSVTNINIQRNTKSIQCATVFTLWK
jgi:hypothetical protein